MEHPGLVEGRTQWASMPLPAKPFQDLMILSFLLPVDPLQRPRRKEAESESSASSHEAGREQRLSGCEAGSQPGSVTRSSSSHKMDGMSPSHLNPRISGTDPHRRGCKFSLTRVGCSSTTGMSFAVRREQPEQQARQGGDDGCLHLGQRAISHACAG